MRTLATNRQLATARVPATSRVLATNRSLVATVIPVAPLLTNAIAGDTQVELYWNFVSNAVTYNVYRALISGGPYSSIATGLTGGYFLDTGRTNDTTYYYVVTAVNGAGESGVSNELSATPLAPPSNPDAIVSGAGTAEANGTYTYTTQLNGKGQYNLTGTDPQVSAISWDGSMWNISTDESIYASDDDVAFPWLATFETTNGSDPPPTVTQG